MLRRTLTLLLVLSGEVGALVLLLRVPAGTLGEIPSLAPEDAVVAAVRLLALTLAVWLTASTVLYAIASAIRLPAIVRGVGWLTLPGVRRLDDGVLATTVVATSTLAIPGATWAMPSGPMAAEFRAPADVLHLYAPHPAGDPVIAESPTHANGRSFNVPSPAGDPVAVESPFPSPASAALDSQSHAVTGAATEAATDAVAGGPVERGHPAPTPSDPAPTSTYVLRVGDHLWSVAADQVAVHTGKHPADLSARDIGPYWVRLVELNQPRLRSGDPNVVYPGETVLVPEPDGARKAADPSERHLK
jgi:hypothetical protein